MADCFPTTILIVGTLSENELDAFVEACEQQAVAWDEFEDSSDLFQYILEECQGTFLELYNPAQNGGDFPVIRDFCEQHDLSYRQITEPGPGQDGFVTCWKPGMTDPKILPIDNDGYIMIRVEDVLVKLARLADEGVRDEYIPAHLEQWLVEEKMFDWGDDVFMISA